MEAQQIHSIALALLNVSQSWYPTCKKPAAGIHEVLLGDPYQHNLK